MDHSLSNSMKLSAMPCRATQDGQVMLENFDKMWSTREGNGKLLQYSCLENLMNSMKKGKDRALRDELPSSVGAQYTTGEEWRNNFRRMKRQSQSKSNALLWMRPVMGVKLDAVKNSIA